MGWIRSLRLTLVSWLAPEGSPQAQAVAPWRCQLESAHRRRRQLMERQGVAKVEIGLVSGRIVLRIFDEHGTHLESVPMPKCLGAAGCRSEELTSA